MRLQAARRSAPSARTKELLARAALAASGGGSRADFHESSFRSLCLFPENTYTPLEGRHARPAPAPGGPRSATPQPRGHAKVDRTLALLDSVVLAIQVLEDLLTAH